MGTDAFSSAMGLRLSPQYLLTNVAPVPLGLHPAVEAAAKEWAHLLKLSYKEKRPLTLNPNVI